MECKQSWFIKWCRLVPNYYNIVCNLCTVYTTLVYNSVQPSPVTPNHSAVSHHLAQLSSTCFNITDNCKQDLKSVTTKILFSCRA